VTGPPRSIVVPITLAADSAQLLEVAAPLAGALGAELTLVGIAPVVPAAPAVAQAGESVGLAPHAEQRLLDLLVQERLDDLSGRLPAAARARTVLTWGPPGPALIAVAREQQAELIVVPMRRDSVLGHALTTPIGTCCTTATFPCSRCRRGDRAHGVRRHRCARSSSAQSFEHRTGHADSRPERLRRCTAMRLHDYAASGNCYKVRLLLALLGREYERVPVDIFAGDTLTDEYAALNPVRETPVLELDSGERIAQSPAILWYLAEGTPFLPGDRLQRALVLQWLAFEQERVMGGIGGTRFRLLTGRPPIAGRLEIGAGALELLEAQLAERAWLVGEGPTIADVAVYGYAHVAHEAGLEPGEHVRAWFERLRALPGFVADLEPYPENARAGAGRSIYG